MRKKMVFMQKSRLLALVMTLVFSASAGFLLQAQSFSDLKKLKGTQKAKTEKPAKKDKPAKKGKAGKEAAAVASKEIDNNIKFEWESNRTMYERREITFKPGDWVRATADKIDKSITDKFNGKDVFFVYEFKYKNKVIATHRAGKKFDIQYGYFRMNILPDPDSTTDIVHRWDWSGKFAEAISKLPGGQHSIEIQGYAESGKDKVLFARGVFTYDNSGGNGKLADIAKNIEKNKGFDIVKENEAFTKKHGRATDVEEQIDTTVFNNCGEDVVITFANKISSTINLTVKWRTYQKIVVSESETVYIKFKGRNIISGPTIGSFEKGKTVNLCK